MVARENTPIHPVSGAIHRFQGIRAGQHTEPHTPNCASRCHARMEARLVGMWEDSPPCSPSGPARRLHLH